MVKIKSDSYGDTTTKILKALSSLWIQVIVIVLNWLRKSFIECLEKKNSEMLLCLCLLINKIKVS